MPGYVLEAEEQLACHLADVPYFAQTNRDACAHVVGNVWPDPSGNLATAG